MTTKTLANRIVQTPNICGGSPRIEGRRIRVKDIVMWFEILGLSADEIAHEYDLALSDIYLALAYYHANQAEMQKTWKKEDAIVKDMIKKYPSRLKNLKSGGKA